MVGVNFEFMIEIDMFHLNKNKRQYNYFNFSSLAEGFSLDQMIKSKFKNNLFYIFKQ